MSPIIWPEVPNFVHDSERIVFEAFKSALGEQDAILTNLKITDPHSGDVEIDLVLFLKDYGCIVVETKGGNISFDGIKWAQSDRSGSRQIDPHRQAIKNMYSFRDYLRSRWSLGNLRTDWVVCFPGSIVPDINSPELPKTMIIDRLELPQALEKVKAILLEQGRQALPSRDDWVEIAVKALMPRSILETNFAAVLENNHSYIRDLTHERTQILNLVADNPRLFVQGPAGSGKTWLAFEQAARWSRQGLRVGIVAYNTGLVSYMKNKSMELPEDDRPAWVGTFHQFATSIGTSAGSPQDYVNGVDPHEEQLLRAAAKIQETEKFDAWIVDEAQDFLSSWWKVLELSLKEPNIGRMAVFGDDQQTIQLNCAKPQGFFANVRLSENLRNSQQIARAVEPLLRTPVAIRGPSGFPVEFIVANFENAMDAADDVIERLTDVENWRPGEIALLTTQHQHPVQKEQIKDREKYWTDLWRNEDVFYGTVGGFKGLERPVVVLAVDGFHHEGNIQDFLYVGMTRARDRLVVVAPEEIINLIRGMTV
jgi:hypothetical protein